MPHIHNNQRFLNRRRELRKNATPEENLLWQEIRAKKLGYIFHRQHSIGPYIVDFYCAHKKLIIELDGNQHVQAVEYDTERKYYLEYFGNKIIRFWNSDLHQNLKKILDEIKRNLV